jgi:hypothetical protein
MLIDRTYVVVFDRSVALRAFVYRFSSEFWTSLGLLCLIASAIAGRNRSEWLYCTLLIGHSVCDINDGLVYTRFEKGVPNGYGLYLDHVCDSIGMAAACYGGYLLVGNLLWCAGLLVLYHLIAIHAWLYKIVKVASGNLHGLHYQLSLSPKYRLALGGGDLAVGVIVVIITGWIDGLKLLCGFMLSVLIFKIGTAIRELRGNHWRQTMIVK